MKAVLKYACVTSLTILCIILQANIALAGKVGSVKKVTRKVHGIPPGEKRIRKRMHASIVQDEILETGEKASLTINLLDGTELTLGSNARLKVDKYVFNQKRDTGKATVELLVGAFYFISGKLEKTRVTLKTPVAYIGVRGTEFAIEVADSGATVVSVIHRNIWMRARDDGSREVGPATHSVSVPSSGAGISVERGLRATGNPAVDSKISTGLRKQGQMLSKSPPQQHGKAGGRSPKARQKASLREQKRIKSWNSPAWKAGT